MLVNLLEQRLEIIQSQKILNSSISRSKLWSNGGDLTKLSGSQVIEVSLLDFFSLYFVSPLLLLKPCFDFSSTHQILKLCSPILDHLGIYTCHDIVRRFLEIYQSIVISTDFTSGQINKRIRD